MGIPISLKDLSYQINELTYHVPSFGKKYYDKSHSVGHEKGQVNGRMMFYDFYAMELMHSFIGSKTKNPHDEPSDSDTVQFRPNQKPINYAAQRVIDDVYGQVVRGVSKKLAEYLKLAVIMEFQYLLTKGDAFNYFRQALVSRYNKNKKITKEEFSELIQHYLPKLADDPELVKRFLKFSKSLGGTPTADYKDVADVASDAVPSPTPADIQDPTANVPDPEPDAALKAATTEPDTTDYSQPPTDDKFADYGPEDDEQPSGMDKKKYDDYKDDDDYFKKEELLREEYINFDRVKKVWKAMKDAHITLHDIARGYNDIQWGAQGFGGPKWGAGAIALLELLEKRQSDDVEFLRGIVDHIYDLQHNTGSMLNKGPMYIKDDDLNRRYKITHIARFIPWCSPMIARLIKAYLHYFTKNPELELNKDKIIEQPKQKLDPKRRLNLRRKVGNGMEVPTEQDFNITTRRETRYLRSTIYPLFKMENFVLLITTSRTFKCLTLGKRSSSI